MPDYILLKLLLKKKEKDNVAASSKQWVQIWNKICGYWPGFKEILELQRDPAQEDFLL